MLFVLAGKSLLFFLTGAMALWVLDNCQPLAQPIRQMVWSGLVLTSLCWAVWHSKAWKNWQWTQVALLIGQSLKPSDGLLIAKDLSAQLLSGQVESKALAQKAVCEVQAQLPQVCSSKHMRIPQTGFWQMIVLSCVCVTILSFVFIPQQGLVSLSRAFWPFGLDTVQGVSRVLPGDQRFPRGHSVPIHVFMSHITRAQPELWVKSAGYEWEKRTLKPVDEKKYQYVFGHLAEPLSYRIYYRGQWTSAWHLQPFDWPSFKDLAVTIHYPPYTQKAAEKLKNTYVFRVIKGARLHLNGRVSQPVSGVEAFYTDGRTLSPQLINGTQVLLDMDIFESGFFHIRFLMADFPSPKNIMADFTVEAVDDVLPRIRILGPAQDLMGSVNEQLPVTYEVIDDFGVSAVFLHYQVNNQNRQKIMWKKVPFKKQTPRILSDKTWHIQSLNLTPGDKVTYYLSATDNNTLTGPGTGRSASFVFQTVSYEADHKALEQSLLKWNQDLLRLLDEQGFLRKTLDGPAPDWAQTLKEQKHLQKKTEEQTQRLQDLTDKMEWDPFMDAWTVSEFKAILDNLRDIKNNPLPQAVKSLHARRKDQAAEAMDDIVSGLERMSLISQNALKSSHMRALMTEGDELTQKAELLTEQLAQKGAGPLSPDEQKKFQRIMEQMNDSFKKIAQQIQKMPMRLPEDFIHQGAVQSLRFDEVQNLMNELQNALRQGDGQKALQAAQDMLQKLKNIQKAMNAAGQGIAVRMGWQGDMFLAQMKKHGQTLKELIALQENLKTKTLDHSKQALNKRMANAKTILTQMAAEQSALIQSLRPLKTRSTRTKNMLSPQAGISLAQADTFMRRARQELSDQNIQQAPHYFERVQQMLRLVAHDITKRKARFKTVQASTVTTQTPYDEAQKIISYAQNKTQYFLSMLKGSLSEEAFLEQEGKERVMDLARAQDQVKNKTLSFQQDMQALAQKTAWIKNQFFRHLKLAAQAMGQAAGHLRIYHLRPAVSDQETALRHLRHSMEQIQSAEQNMSAAGQSLSGAPKSTLQGYAPPGAVGFRTGPVRIPKPEDHKPPRAFREELLKSLKEKYPKTYQKIIEDYFKNWAD